MTKVSELIDYIPVQSIEKIATLLLIIWVLSPIVVMFSNCSMQDVEDLDFMFKQIAITTSWYEILQTTGFLGCILGIIIFSKSKNSKNLHKTIYKE